jgi:hypothetical protein
MSQMRTDQLEGRKREERVREPGYVARHKRGLTSCRGGRGRSGLVSLETWYVTHEDSLPGGEEEGGAAWLAWKRGMSQTRTHNLEGRKREARVGELGNVARHKKGLTDWRGGRVRRGLVSLETWHVTDEHSPTVGEEEGRAVW